MKQKAEVSQKGLADPDARLAEGKSLAEGPWAKLISKQSAEGVRHPDAIAFFQAYAQAIDAGTHGNRTVEGWSLGCFYSRPSGKLNVIISRDASEELTQSSVNGARTSVLHRKDGVEEREGSGRNGPKHEFIDRRTYTVFAD